MNVLWHAVRRASVRRLDLSVASSPTLVVLGLALLFLATHLPFVAPGPGSVDARNFALGVRHFDPADHRPHPPGYPVFIALGKITHAIVPLGPADGDSLSNEARALAVWSAIFGAIAVFPLFIIFRSLEFDNRRAAAATVLTVACPLFWFTSVRSMSDIPGLAVACMAQALLFTAHRRQLQSHEQAWRLVFVGAMVSGLAVGIRSQTVWLTAPLLIAVTAALARTSRERRVRNIAFAGHAFAAGVAIWAVPLVAASGGPSSYLMSLGIQANLDFADVDMLVRHPSVGRFVAGLVSTFGYPWANEYLAGSMLAGAAIGGVVMAMRSRAALGWLAVASGPYLVFSLLYHDPAFSRYALPTVPAVAYLAVRGLERLSSRGLPVFTLVMVAGCLAVAWSPVIRYATTGGSAYQAISAVREALEHHDGVQPVLATHQEVGLAIRGESVGTPQLAFPGRYEWLEVMKYWLKGGSAPVWFLSDSSRTDLALVDPATRTLRREFRLPFNNRFFMSGARPAGVDWHELAEPGWIADEGWALTPETAGVAWRSARGPGYRPITAWVRRRSEAALMMIGGRNLGRPGEPDVRFEAAIDGRPIASWSVAPEPGFFLKTIDLPAGTLEGEGRYAALTIAARPTDGVIRQVNAAIEQFDVQSSTRPMLGYDTGWYQLESNPVEQQLWRWTGPWAVLRVHNAGRDLTLRITGDSPLKHNDRIPTVTVRAGDRVLGQLSPSDDFVFEVPLPAAALANAGGEVFIESDATFVPDDRLRNGDRRPLGLRIFDVVLN